MKHLTAIVASYSDIISGGILALLGNVKKTSFNTVCCRPDDVVDVVVRHNPSVVIADAASFTPRLINEVRDECDAGATVIGVYYNAMRPAETACYDAMVSIFADAQTLGETIEQQMGEGNSGNENSELTPREKEVVKAVVKGLSNKEIATEMHVSVNTVMTHRRNIASKLQIHSPAGLTIYAIVSKLVNIEDVRQ